MRKVVVGPVWEKVKELEEENRLLREYIDERFAAQDRRFDELDVRMNVLSQAKTQERGLPSASYLPHQDIRRRLDNLADQVLVNVAVNSGSQDARQEAQVIASMAVLLFPAQGPAPDAGALAQRLQASGLQIGADQLGRACELAAEIRTAADATGHTIVWDFALDPGAPLDPERQQPHGGRDGEGTADFVTMPGYSADGKVYVKQRVFMVPRPVQPSQPEPAGALPPEQPTTGETAVLTVRVVVPFPKDRRQRPLITLEELAKALQGERPERTVLLSETTHETAHRHIAVQADGRTLCTIDPTVTSAKVEVIVRGDNDEVIACAGWFQTEVPALDLLVYFQRTEPNPWAKAWLPPSSGETPSLAEFLLGHEPKDEQ
ncbi:hypothetical protein ACWDDN_24940 [Streptomyces griseoruber]